MKPLFSEGEEVILQSVTHPQFNGEYIVESVIPPKACYQSRVSKEHYIQVYDKVMYRLDVVFDYLPEYGELLVEEKELRKKHKPSGDSFESMITKLKGSQKLSEKTS